MRKIQPFLRLGPTGSITNLGPGEAGEVEPVKDFRPRNFVPVVPEPVVVVVVPEETMEDEVDPEADPKAASPASPAIGSASGSVSVTSENSTPASEVSPVTSPIAPSPSSVTPASAAKGILQHPSMKPGKTTPPAEA